MAAKLPDFAGQSHLRTLPETRLVENLVFHNWTRAERMRDAEGARNTVLDALARWRALGLPAVRDASGEHRYDPAEVALFMRYCGYEGEDPYWRKYHVTSVRNLVLSFHPPATPADVAPRALDLPARRITVTMQRRFNPAYLLPNGRLRLPVPQLDASTRNLDVSLDPVEGTEGSVRLTDDYAELRLADVPAGPVVLGARFAFDAYPSAPSGPGELPAAERELYLRSSEDILRITPGVAALAGTLAAGASDPLEQVLRFYAYVTKRLDRAPFPYEALELTPPAHYPRQMGWFDCRRLSAFLVALCRARGIPARRATGYLVYPESVNYHHWIEAWIEGQGWFPIDQLSAEAAAVGQEPAWASALVGSLDYRFKMGYMPRAFNGSPGVRLPTAWTSLEGDADGATRTDIIDMADQSIVWTDVIRIDLGAPLAAS